MAANSLDLTKRLSRTKGRDTREEVLGIRFSTKELTELKQASVTHGTFTGEWAREVLLREARAAHSERATFTEIVAIRLLLNAIFEPREKPLTAVEFDGIVTRIRSEKHTGASELLSQYTNPLGGLL